MLLLRIAFRLSLTIWVTHFVGIRCCNSEEIIKHKAHESMVEGVGFLNGNERFVTVENHARFRIWNASSLGKAEPISPDERGTYNCLAISPDGSTFATGGVGGVVYQRTKAGDLITTWDYGAEIIDLSFDPAGKYLSVVGSKNEIVFWDLNSKKRSKIEDAHQSGVYVIEFSPNGKYLASAGGSKISIDPDRPGNYDNKTVRVWDMSSRKIYANLKGHTSGIEDIKFSRDGTLIASGGWDNTVILWDVKSMQIVTQLKQHKDCVLSIAFSPDKKYMATGSRDRSVVLWDISDSNHPKAIRTMASGKGSVLCLTFSPDSSKLIAGTSEGDVFCWTKPGW